MSAHGLDRTLAALADPHRRRVVDLLRERPYRAGDLAQAARISFPAMSRYLKTLRLSGLVEEAFFAQAPTRELGERYAVTRIQADLTFEERMINGMHVIIYSRDAEADRDFIREVLGFPAVDAGGGWLIFAAPPSEVACHPGENNDKHELYLMCDNVEKEVERLKQSRIKCGPISREEWGLLTTIELPGGGRLRLYEPRHPRPHR